MTLQAAITHVQETIAAISGIRAAPEYPPENSSAFPFTVAYAGPGTFTPGAPAGMMKYLGSIIIDLHVARKDLPRDAAKAMGFHDSIPAALCDDPTIGGHVSTFSVISVSGLIAMAYGDVQTLGIRFTIEAVKIQTVL